VTHEHDSLRDLLAPVALGAAETHEVERVEAHAAECAVCREELAGLRAGADVLAVAVPQREPPERVRDSLMATVRAEADARRAQAAPEAPVRARPRPRRARLRPWHAVAVLAAVAALLLAWNIALQVGSDDGADDVATLPVSGTADAPGVTGQVVYVPGQETAVMRLEGLPGLDPAEAYQLWVIRDGAARSAGLFEPDVSGAAVRATSGLAGAQALAVTAQPRANRATPEGPILVEAPLS
jgi:hypothetical protein